LKQQTDTRTSISRRFYTHNDRLDKETTNALLDTARKGKSYVVAAKQINELTEASYKRALRIARTEGGRVQSIAKQRSYVEAKKKGVDLKKKWLSTLDSKTRDTHQGLDGQVVEIEEKFVSPNGHKADGSRLFGVASEDIHCRCTTITEVNGLSPELRMDNDGYEIPYENYKDWYNKRIGEQERKASSGEYGADLEYVRTKSFWDKVSRDPQIGHIADEVVSVTRRMLQHRNGTPFEDYYLLNKNTGKIAAVSNKARIKKGVVYNKQVLEAYKGGEPDSYISIHNHPSGFPPSLSDISAIGSKNKHNTVKLGLVAGHDGSLYWYTKANRKFNKNDIRKYDIEVAKNIKKGYTEAKAQEIALEEFSKEYNF